MTCATTSRTSQPAHSVGACHCCGDSVARNAAKSARSSRAKRRTSTAARLAPRTAQAPPVSAGVGEGELFAVVVEVLGGVPVQVGEGHVVGEERVPRGGVVHPALQGSVVLGGQAAFQCCDHP